MPMENVASQKLVVLDAGGQYCHLIARRLRQVGVYADVKPCATPSADLGEYRGIIISGGPSSVYDARSPKIDEGVFGLGKPVLGICYGHQLMAHFLGGEVRRGAVAEYGVSRLSVVAENSLFKDAPPVLSVWMSHRDLVTAAPENFELLAQTPSCPVAAMGDHRRKLYGVQFHPEVVHTQRGNELLRTFSTGICGCTPNAWRPAEQVDALLDQIRAASAGKKVFFFISGGVDSTVAFVLCLRALGTERVEGVFVDTGFMRPVDLEDIASLQQQEHARIHVEDCRGEFLALLDHVYSPEEKRRRIGEHFIAVHERVIANRFAGQADQWLLGQGTIYPDTIESGATQHSSKIKTHHNRVGSILEMLRAGRVVEPLAQFYKDEVRQIGESLGITGRILNKQPFPGPGLAIRCICSEEASGAEENPILARIAGERGLSGLKVNLKTVGVKGDERSYENVALLDGGSGLPGCGLDGLEEVSTGITNEVADVTRVLLRISGPELRASHWRVAQRWITEERLDRLRRADSHVRDYMLGHAPDLMGRIWQFPVILLPLVDASSGRESVVLRPVDSVDGMTASFFRLPEKLLLDLSSGLETNCGCHVFLDITHKPPATIEWE